MAGEEMSEEIRECRRCCHFRAIEVFSRMTGRCCHPDYDRPVVYGSASPPCFVPIIRRESKVVDITDELSPDDRAKFPEGVRVYERREEE